MGNNHKKQMFNKYGQFMTEDKLVKSILKTIDKISPIQGTIMEPSFGKGAFIYELMRDYAFDKLDAYEVDPPIFNEVKIENDNRVNLYLNDFIFTEINDQYNHIIGNPPYIELNYSFYSPSDIERLKQQYNFITDGRINLVHMFVHKSHALLKNNGYLSFLVPSIILTSPYYKKLRKFIYDNFNIEYVKNDVKFSGISIKVALVIMKKTAIHSNNYFVNYNNAYYITEDYKNYPKSKHTLKDEGFNVTVGNICWNQHKPELTDDNTCTPIIYTKNIMNNKISFDVKLSTNKEKNNTSKTIKSKNLKISLHYQERSVTK